MKQREITVLAAALAAFGIGFLTACGSGSNSAAATNANKEPVSVEVTTEQAVIRPIPTYVEATGNLASDEQTDVAPAVAGKIVEVNFDIGSYVKEGDVLVRLDNRDATIRLQQAEAQVEQQRQAAQQAEANAEQALANLRQTQARLGIKDGETFRIEDFSQVKSISAQLDLAEKEFRRAEKLLETGDISKSAYDQRRSQRDALIGQLDEARSNAAIAIRAVDTARAAYEAAKAGARTAQAAIATLETQVAQARKALSDTIVRAPITGYVSDKSADVGEYISPNTPNAKLATIMRTSVLRMKIEIPEQSISRVATGQSVSLQVTSYPERQFAGRIARISPSVNQTARTLIVEAEIDNSEGLLKPGQFATVRITQSKPEPAVMIPVRAVKTVGETNSVFVVKDGVAREHLVLLGLLEGDWIQVKRGIVEGDSVVVTNLDKLSDGILVRQ
jgi:multidrug efflux pump subunit AcrA (membrane-fusion protein)